MHLLERIAEIVYATLMKRVKIALWTAADAGMADVQRNAEKMNLIARRTADRYEELLSLAYD